MQEQIDYQWEEFANAIICRAVEDYRNALRKRNRNTNTSPAVNTLEKFFRSEYYSILTNLDGEYIIESIRHEMHC
jgi:hypothetical protein